MQETEGRLRVALERPPLVAHRLEQGIADTVDWYLDHQDWVQRVLDGSYRLERIGGVAA